MLNDNDRRAAEWRRLLGEYFAPRLGGTPPAWAEANRRVFLALWDDWHRLRDRGLEAGPSWWPDQDRRWLSGMCEQVGVTVPADVDGTVRASRAHVMAHIDCAYPDAGSAMRAMRTAGLTLHLASGGQSRELEAYLRRMGVWELIERPYGVDLLGVNKTSARYYERIREDSDVDPRDALVVDSHAEPLEWADAAGFRTVHVDRLRAGSRFVRFDSLQDLVKRLTAER
ncbi:MAG: hypothetical protein M3Z65_05020 [Chloroflexota bacterium]|nr:hypothetical protein [Chloroflexota bacterium]